MHDHALLWISTQESFNFITLDRNWKKSNMLWCDSIQDYHACMIRAWCMHDHAAHLFYSRISCMMHAWIMHGSLCRSRCVMHIMQDHAWNRQDFFPWEIPATTRLLVGEWGKVILICITDSIWFCFLARSISALAPKLWFSHGHIEIIIIYYSLNFLTNWSNSVRRCSL